MSGISRLPNLFHHIMFNMKFESLHFRVTPAVRWLSNEEIDVLKLPASFHGV